MKTINKFFAVVVFIVGLVTFNSCEIETIENQNGPSIESLVEGASLADLRLLASGLESILRTDMEFYFWTVSMVGREYWDLNNTDPRYTGELLGVNGAPLDNNGFLTTRSFGSRYRAIRNALVLIEATQNANAGLTTEEENGLIGYAKTLQAYSLLLVANRQFTNGVRLDVTDPDNLGPFVDYAASLTGIRALLDEAATDLSNAGSEFAFFLSSGFDGFNTPAAFRQFNRALAARVAIYQDDKPGAITALAASFFNINGDLNTGVSYAFGGAVGNDRANPLFYVADQDLYTAHPSWEDNIEAGDTRLEAKTRLYTEDPEEGLPPNTDGLTGPRQVSLIASQTSPFPIIRNAELVLLYAEAQIGTNAGEVTAAINIIRNAAGLPDYAGPDDAASLLAEVLNQRRYELFAEGHRWLDMRRTGNLDEIPIDRPGDQVFELFPRPILEE
ncbi:MAG: RagB/SusD family nutrient uptake outer membrane protein [Bacteroidota bacterium]